MGAVNTEKVQWRLSASPTTRTSRLPTVVRSIPRAMTLPSATNNLWSAPCLRMSMRYRISPYVGVTRRETLRHQPALPVLCRACPHNPRKSRRVGENPQPASCPASLDLQENGYQQPTSLRTDPFERLRSDARISALGAYLNNLIECEQRRARQLRCALPEQRPLAATDQFRTIKKRIFHGRIVSTD